MIGVARRILDSQLSRVGSQHLTHEVLTTFLAEVTAIMNARPLVPVSSDPESPFILTPATLLTQKTGVLPPPHGDFNEKDLLRQQWRRVQSLANSFWNRWRKEYLSTLQSRRKWHSTRPNLQQGDVVLLKDPLAKRNQWPMGVIEKVHSSSDGLVRKVEVKVVKDGHVTRDSWCRSARQGTPHAGLQPDTLDIQEQDGLSQAGQFSADQSQVLYPAVWFSCIGALLSAVQYHI
ncbi:hypothetical protein WMY93_009593 [Mugilogobius chulae]|uniref:DUF5641 domain-containing protein n=1 Tax=Mugilogobius chulae TaxID=88201 RepID=A0AAW0PC13_9GOBI